MGVTLPDADYVVLASRLIPGLDGGHAFAVLSRARLLHHTGAAHPLLLTFDPGDTAAHSGHRQHFAEEGLIATPSWMRNLFDEARTDPSWLHRAAVPGEATPGVEYREIVDANGDPVLSLPVIPGNPDWHLTDATVLVHGSGAAPEGTAGSAGTVRVLPGFRGLYRAWLEHVVAGLREASDDPDRMVVVICETRQIGELLVDWADPRVRIVHTTHNSHLSAPYDDPFGEIAPPWARWFDVIDAYDSVWWLTASQQADVQARFGERDTFAVVPNPVAPPQRSGFDRDSRRAVMLGRLAPQKRVDLALRSWQQVVAAVSDARLDIYGDGPLRGELASQITELGLDESVRLCGFTDDRDAVLGQAALLLSSAAFEGQPLAIAEALIRGLPVVSFDVRYGARDTVGGGGVLVSSGDVQALADAVIGVFEDDQRRAALSEAAVAAGSELLADQVAPVMVAALQAAVSREPGRRPYRRA